MRGKDGGSHISNEESTKRLVIRANKVIISTTFTYV